MISTKLYVTDMPIKTGARYRIINALLQHGFYKVEDICLSTEEHLGSIPYLKGRNLGVIKQMLTDANLRFGMTKKEVDAYYKKYRLTGRPGAIYTRIGK